MRIWVCVCVEGRKSKAKERSRREVFIPSGWHAIVLPEISRYCAVMTLRVLYCVDCSSQVASDSLRRGNLAAARPQGRTTKHSMRKMTSTRKRKVQDPGLQLINQSISFLDDVMPHGSKSSLQLLSPSPFISAFLDYSTQQPPSKTPNLQASSSYQHRVKSAQACRSV